MKKIMRSAVRLSLEFSLYFSLCLSVLLIGSCQKETQKDPVIKGPTNKTAQKVSLYNGQMELDIPAGAMQEGLEIRVQSSTEAFADPGSVLQQFELLPAGTKFNKPVTLTLHYTDEMLKGNPPENIGLAFKNEADQKWYALIGGKIDKANKTIAVKITHFSNWAYYSGLHLYAKVNGELSRDNDLSLPMLTGDMAEVCVVMDLPPLSAADEEMLKILKEVGDILERHQDPVNPIAAEDCPDCALLAPVTFTPPVTTDDIHNKMIKPDKWTVNGVVNGNQKTGKITEFVGNIYNYNAPEKMPADNPMAIAAVINTKSHGQLQLIQQVNVYAKKWRWTYSENYSESCNGAYDLDLFGFKAASKTTVDFSFKTGFVLTGVNYHNVPWTVSAVTNCSPNLTELSVTPEKNFSLECSGLKKGNDFLQYYDYNGDLFLNMNTTYNGNFTIKAINNYNDGSGMTEPFTKTRSTGNYFGGENGILIPNTPYKELADLNSIQKIEAL